MSMRHSVVAIAAVTIAATATLTAQGDKTTDFKWNDLVTAGHWVRVTNLNGRITVREGTGDRVEVSAVKRWRRGDPATVRIEAKKTGDDAVICAMWGDQTSCGDRYQTNRGRDWRGRWNNNNDDDVSVDFTITMPRGVKLSASNVNGSVEVAGLTADIEANTVNGGVSVEANGGSISATTVNGEVYAKITSRAGDGRMRFETVNGGIVAELAPSVGADIDMETVNGGLRTDYDITVRGRIDPRRLSAHVGPAGGPRISLTTVNGGIELRKR